MRPEELGLMSQNLFRNASRRSFLASSAVVAGLAVPEANAELSAEESAKTVVVGVMGVMRGLALAGSLSGIPGVEVRYLCDTDSLRLKSAHESFSKSVKYNVRTTSDFREILKDADVDALIVAAPNHWHAPAAILACAAGKHVYVEKPCSHNPREGELLTAAARKHRRCVQMGSQRRSGDQIKEAIRLLHEGRIGRVYYSRSWYAALRGDIGHGVSAAVPEHIDYELWQGPAPRQPYTSNRLHYNWHWTWHYGNGELGNNGIHYIDLSRWGLQVDYPTRVVSSGGRYRFSDDQETADTHVVSFEFEGKKQIFWEGLSCSRDGLYGDGFGASFHGENGSMRVDNWGFAVYDHKGKEVDRRTGTDGLAAHLENFVTAVRADDSSLLNAEIEEGHKSTLLCHLGNIALRTGDTIRCDPTDGHIIGHPDAEAFWSRKYEPGWEPIV